MELRLKGFAVILAAGILATFCPTSHAQEAEVSPGVWVEKVTEISGWVISKVEAKSGGTCYAHYKSDFGTEGPLPFQRTGNQWGLIGYNYGLGIIADYNEILKLDVITAKRTSQLQLRKTGEKFFDDYKPYSGIPLTDIPENTSIDIQVSGFQYPNIKSGYHSNLETYSLSNLMAVKENIELCKSVFAGQDKTK